MSDPWVPPDDVRSTCSLCGEERTGMEAIVAHLTRDHGMPEPDRWPDGGLVFDSSAIADDIVDGTGQP